MTSVDCARLTLLTTSIMSVFLVALLGANVAFGAEGTKIDKAAVDADPDAKLIDVPYLNQLDVVYGCEAVSATMVLQYYGVEITWKEFTDDYLIKKPWHVDENGRWFGPDPFAAYPGDPYKDDGPNCGFGCYAPSLAKSMNAVLPKDKRAVVTTGLKLCDLLANYIDKGDPVLVWGTMNMAPSRLTRTWTIDYVDENSPYRLGDSFTWLGNEHCLVLIGYDSERFFFNDPYENHGLIAYDRDLFEQRFREFGEMSVVVRKAENK